MLIIYLPLKREKYSISCAFSRFTYLCHQLRRYRSFSHFFVNLKLWMKQKGGSRQSIETEVHVQQQETTHFILFLCYVIAETIWQKNETENGLDGKDLTSAIHKFLLQLKVVISKYSTLNFLKSIFFYFIALSDGRMKFRYFWENFGVVM